MKTLLIIDDEKNVRSTLNEQCQDLVDRVIEAPDGTVGMKIIESQRPSVIVSDYLMPGLDGIELLKFLREKRIFTPVIWLTAVGSPTLYRDAWRLGVFEYFDKPYDPNLIRRAISAALDMGTQFNVHRKPSFISKELFQEVPIYFEKPLFDEVTKYCIEEGLSISTYLHRLMERDSTNRL